MNTNRRGISTTGILVVLGSLVVVVLGGLYFFSDVFHTRMKGAWKDFAQWTPENIAKDPTGYLDFCEEQTNKAIIKLKASDITIEKNRIDFTAKRDAAKGDVDNGNKALSELKDLYTSADRDDSWPLKWLDRSFDKDQAKKQIVRFDRETRSKTNELKMYEQAIKLLDVQKSKLQDAKDKANEQLTSIQTSREQLKVKAITDDLKGQLVAMGSVLTSVVGVADEKSTMSLSDLSAKSETKVDDQEFTKIMGGTH